MRIPQPRHEGRLGNGAPRDGPCRGAAALLALHVTDRFTALDDPIGGGGPACSGGRRNTGINPRHLEAVFEAHRRPKRGQVHGLCRYVAAASRTIAGLEWSCRGLSPVSTAAKVFSTRGTRMCTNRCTHPNSTARTSEILFTIHGSTSVS